MSRSNARLGPNPRRAPLALATAAALVLGTLHARAANAPVVLQTTELGSGATLVFVPDIGMARTVWMPTARKLIAGHRIVLVDLPGHGESPMPDPFSLVAAAEALDQVLAKQKGESTIVIGHGFGGVLTAMAAQTHPAHVKGVVLIDVVMKAPRKIADQQKQMFFRWMDENYDAFLRQVYGARGRDSTQGNEIVAQASLVPRSHLMPYFRELVSLDQAETLKGFPRPLLYVGTERGWPAEKTWAALAAERGLSALAAPDTVRIPASAQLVMKDQPDSLASAIGKFAAKVLASH